jgi:uncharacterized OB-fold protein
MDSLDPIVNRLNRPFWDAAAKGELSLPHCAVTGRAFWPPSPISPFAEGAAVQWRACEPFGVIKAMVAYRRVFHPAFASLTPFGVALVELECGPRLQAHVVAPDSRHAPRAGQRVRLTFRPILPDGPPIPIVDITDF